jgi:hypothetical protein
MGTPRHRRPRPNPGRRRAELRARRRRPRQTSGMDDDPERRRETSVSCQRSSAGAPLGAPARCWVGRRGAAGSPRERARGGRRRAWNSIAKVALLRLPDSKVLDFGRARARPRSGQGNSMRYRARRPDSACRPNVVVRDFLYEGRANRPEHPRLLARLRRRRCRRGRRSSALVRHRLSSPRPGRAQRRSRRRSPRCCCGCRG